MPTSLKPLSKRLFKDSRTGIFQVQIQTPHGRRKFSLQSRDRATALDTLNQSEIPYLEKAAKLGLLTDKAVSQVKCGKNMTVERAIGEYIETMKSNYRAPKTSHNHEVELLAWARLPSTPEHLMSVRPAQISAAVNKDKDAKVSTRTAKLGILRKFFDYCVHSGYSFSNPARLTEIDLTGVPFERKETVSSEPMTDDEVATVLSAAEGFWLYATAIGRWAGLRLGDICQLESDSFRTPGKMIVWTDKRDRRVEIPIEPELKKWLAKLPKPDGKYYWPEMRIKANAPGDRAGMSTYYGRLLGKLGVEGKTFKSLRVAYVRACQANGVSMPHIALRVGHASTVTTEKYYAGKH